MVAVAHPDLFAVARMEKIRQDRVVHDLLDESPAEFTARAAFHLAAQLLHHHLLAIADAEHRHAELKNRIIGARAVVPCHAGRAARQDHGLRVILAEKRRIDLVERVDFTIDAALAQASCDQLRHLAAEIDDEGAFVSLLSHGAR